MPDHFLTYINRVVYLCLCFNGNFEFRLLVQKIEFQVSRVKKRFVHIFTRKLDKFFASPSVDRNKKINFFRSFLSRFVSHRSVVANLFLFTHHLWFQKCGFLISLKKSDALYKLNKKRVNITFGGSPVRNHCHRDLIKIGQRNDRKA